MRRSAPPAGTPAGASPQAAAHCLPAFPNATLRGVESHLDELLRRYPALAVCRHDIERALQLLIDSFTRGGKLLLCGNGGSAADCDHIAGELLKGYLSPRPLPPDVRSRLSLADPEMGPILAETLQGALPAINLSAAGALLSAFGNDVKAEHAYAQAAFGHGRRGDVLLGLSTSGNALNVRAALCVARAMGLSTIGLTGEGGGKMAGRCDVLIAVPARRTFEVQELHLPVYHCLCAMVEAHFFG
jgi:D-sedoheptulose 7-phosphate isomerase